MKAGKKKARHVSAVTDPVPHNRQKHLSLTKNQNRALLSGEGGEVLLYPPPDLSAKGIGRSAL